MNKDYPRFITTGEIRDDAASMQFGDVPETMEGEEEEEECDDEGCECHHHHHEEEEEIYLGNAFEGFEERYEESLKNKK